MIGWGSILYGAALSALAAAAVLTAMRVRPLLVRIAASACAIVGPVGWNAVLRATHADLFFTDAPTKVFPVSWQDTGSGVVTLAVAAIVLGGGIMRTRLSSEVMRLAAVVAGVAFLVDIYLF